MTAFFICIILIGVLMVGVAMVWMVIEKKNMRDYRLDLDERRNDLAQVIEDAEELLTELNRFSDYVVNRMEEKQQDVESIVRSVDERLDLFQQLKDIQLEVSEKHSDASVVAIEQRIEQDDLLEFQPIKKGKVIPLDVRRREVVKLYKKGMDSTEIARILNMGKGEIELISRMCQ